MWQRFTERARRVVFFSQEEATRLGAPDVGSAHLLLGLVRDTDSVAVRVFDRLGVTVDRICSEVEREIKRRTPAATVPRGQDRPLSPRAKHVVELAYDEARQLNNNYIGTEHLLLALIRDTEGVSGQVLADLGIELALARREVVQLQNNLSGSPNPSRALARVFTALPVADQDALRAVGVPYADLSLAMRRAVEAFFQGVVGAESYVRVDLDEAIIQITAKPADNDTQYTVSARTVIHVAFTDWGEPG